jgi:hypothetical protein
MHFVTVLLFIFSSLSAEAASKPAGPYREFIDTCVSAFSQSTGTEDHGGKKICECVSEESKHQGVKVGELKKETAEIKKDPKYKIQNPKLLAAFHYCSVLSMEESEHAH